MRTPSKVMRDEGSCFKRRQKACRTARAQASGNSRAAELVSLRDPSRCAEYFQEDGPGWQDRILRPCDGRQRDDTGKQRSDTCPRANSAAIGKRRSLRRRSRRQLLPRLP